ncbi:hypothetical protein CDD82_7369 [Ophiocordyceps australis]|uniref:BZIP domain-containing protein n=1 Tax=Ophiocordyceps australis TaxID=1399860 RepID=A0A2C5ZRD1_9HYPO|nr:hypothetical protein CDD82_7369 [Ophiocordyceps australis]
MSPRSSSAEPAKTSKRKGTRSVSSLTPSQLARKRANDREAQRAIRARTKEHIERLERELEELRSSHSRDRTVQELLRRNRALEDELRRIKDNLGPSLTSSPYSTPAGTDYFTSTGRDSILCQSSLQRLTPCPSVYDDNLSVTSSGAMPSPQMSPMPSGAEYTSVPDYSHQAYVALPKNCESWASSLPASGIPSSVPSPCSSVNADEYGTNSAYIPTSMPASMMPHGAGSLTKDVKIDFDDMQNMASQSYLQSQQRSQTWNMYPMYYDGTQHQQATCVSR